MRWEESTDHVAGEGPFDVPPHECQHDCAWCGGTWACGRLVDPEEPCEDGEECQPCRFAHAGRPLVLDEQVLAQVARCALSDGHRSVTVRLVLRDVDAVAWDEDRERSGLAVPTRRTVVDARGGPVAVLELASLRYDGLGRAIVTWRVSG